MTGYQATYPAVCRSFLAGACRISEKSVLNGTFRESDIIGRIGGDEFAVLAIDVAESACDTFSQRLEQAIRGWQEKDNRSYMISLSWGDTLYDPGSPVSLDQLVSEADRLMYARKKAKASGAIMSRGVPGLRQQGDP